MKKLILTTTAIVLGISALAISASTPSLAEGGGYSVFVPDGKELKKINRRASMPARRYCEQILGGRIAIDVKSCDSRGRNCNGYCDTSLVKKQAASQQEK